MFCGLADLLCKKHRVYVSVALTVLWPFSFGLREQTYFYFSLCFHWGTDMLVVMLLGFCNIL